MAKLLFAALLALGSAAAAAQPASPVPLQPSVDSPQTREAFRRLMVCLADARPRWARRTLDLPYLSDDQARVASHVLTGSDSCTPGREAEFTFRTSSTVASLAEYFLKAEIGRVDFAQLSSVLSTLRPRNASEDFAQCVTSRDPEAARDLALSDLGSAAEMAAAGRLAPHLAPCIDQGERLPVDLQALRALSAAALYRGVRTVLAGGN